MHRSPLVAILASLVVFSVPASSLNLLQSAPSCAQGCTNLLNAQGACIPPAVPVTSLQDYKSCFCGMATGGLNGAPQTYCDTCPEPNQYEPMQKWFNNYCDFNQPSPTPTPSPTAPISTAPTLSNTAPPRTRHRLTSTVPHHHHHHHPKSTSSTSTSSNTGIPAVSGEPFGEGNPNESWWAGHYQWIVMVIILILGFSAIIGAGIYFKRRYDMKHNVTSELPSNTPWAPNTSQFRSSSVYGDEPGQAFFSRNKGATPSTADRSWPK